MAAPIALFVFRRPDKTRATLESLARCRGINNSDLYIFCDGPRGANDDRAVADVRAIVDAFDHPQKTLVISTENQGLARSIIAGAGRMIFADRSAFLRGSAGEVMSGNNSVAAQTRASTRSGDALSLRSAAPSGVKAII